MSDQDTHPLPQDTAFDLLSNTRRRFVLRRLQGVPEGIELKELANELAARENGVEPDALSSQQRKRTYVSLYQTHIPKLAEAGVVDYDADTGVVSSTDRVDHLARYFESEEPSSRWTIVYFSLSVAGLLLYAITVFLSVPIVDPIYVAIGGLLLVAVTSVVHYLYTDGGLGAKRTNIPAHDE
ncbi:hypothetical protein GRS48_11675 [Halorubrum sp. JWXQ-INN 858]|uniref:DUF7344 domain-containing protein n=1 Tax=Halorubrum sp. JWXQ-INN 858 TaxID=2690782 RepID=UPI00135C86FA|nr:hypothetical protein [Halorubrum sp. JWXQ-INN 858]MWV65470.1 hypothetical protein [Halorubrum sp. JWXQ-INN 858]